MEKTSWEGLVLTGAVFCVIMAKGFSEREQYFIPVDGQLIEVTREVYIAYYQAERRERYLKEQEQKYGVLYMGMLEENYLEKCSYLRAWEETGVQAVGKVYLESLMDRLEEKEKDVFRLYCVEGYSLRATADRMGIHYLKARRMLKHIREKLKSQL
ncbi:MAG: sigma factor-like helix-turn-helix DNA-binding protein [Lachnospiraceae bacterium]